ncbi:hypothetical protein [Cellvibrio japonicus]|uniref:Uncharacterized protein n=1 Tax=Cellvibrio japonicus (strain Ueda107) TaxID=498211 RepID=B3PC65_CELJU|nr:hypothetical protein [Cellvibrio japonicus]ACE84024.1 hypothetical protein CJA_2879 [Cellvibrio japonicus Ueda107]QEI13207.1 hypothetical protein FY117_13885 [Cellvibrio japonicus]QEI16781.1 hypothetical protein FY116_13890 [Cellvibrio japonicus]QEI20359.1 hypothetical protein FY115_13885 [Cellvibrio japonicus]
MLKPLVSAAVFGLVSFASVAQAADFVSHREVSGVITKINAAKHTMTVMTEQGKTENFSIAPHARVATVKGKNLSLSRLEIGHSVTLKQRFQPLAGSEIKGEILAINHSDLSVKIREMNSGNILHVKFDEQAHSTGIGANSFENLRRGNDLVVRNTAK